MLLVLEDDDCDRERGDLAGPTTRRIRCNREPVPSLRRADGPPSPWDAIDTLGEKMRLGELRRRAVSPTRGAGRSLAPVQLEIAALRLACALGMLELGRLPLEKAY
jgi:hypothetical protein